MAKDRKIDMVILGLLTHENLTGYDIKKRIDSWIRFFWKGSFGNIYPALSAMEKDGLVKKEKDMPKQNGREKIWYAITDEGRKTLNAWLENSKATNDLKYETMLKIFFGASVAPSISVRTIEEFEKEVGEDLALLKLYKEDLSNRLDERDHVHYYLTVSFGVETYEGYLRWCKEAKKLLENRETDSL